MNPTQQSPNTGRTFQVGARYWWRQSDDYVMPRENSRFEQPKGFVAVIATSETQLDFDNGGLDALPRDVDPTDPNMVGAAVSYAGDHVRGPADQAPTPRPMPVTMQRAMDDHQVRARAEQALAENGTPSTVMPSETEGEAVDIPDTAEAPKRRRRSQQ